MILGVDPGITGAMAALDHRGELVDFLTMPTKLDGQKKVIDVITIKQWLRDLPIERAILERVHSMPGQGVSSMFNFGRAYGVAEAVLMYEEIPFDRVTPQAWKGHFHMMLKGKDASREKAQVIWGDPIFETKAKGQAVADAALLALFGIERGAQQ